MNPEVINGLIRSHQNMIGYLQRLLKQKAEKKFEPKVMYPSDYIIQEVNIEFDCELRTNTRKKQIMDARHAAVYLLRNHTTLTWEGISIKVGNTDHTSAIHSYKTASNLIETDDYYHNKIESVKEKLKILIN
jgi:chromosomal replication initiation ATPase DnaA